MSKEGEHGKQAEGEMRKCPGAKEKEKNTPTTTSDPECRGGAWRPGANDCGSCNMKDQRLVTFYLDGAAGFR